MHLRTGHVREERGNIYPSAAITHLSGLPQWVLISLDFLFTRV